MQLLSSQEPALELHSWAAPSVEAHHHVNRPDTGRNSGERQIRNYDIKKVGNNCYLKMVYSIEKIYTESHFFC